jgi:hypothetical protein
MGSEWNKLLRGDLGDFFKPRAEKELDLIKAAREEGKKQREAAVDIKIHVYYILIGVPCVVLVPSTSDHFEEILRYANITSLKYPFVIIPRGRSNKITSALQILKILEDSCS